MSLTPRTTWVDSAADLSGDVVPLRPVEQPQATEVVRKLREVLARAERGEIIGVAVACSMTDRRTASVYEIGDGDVSLLVTAMARVQLRLLRIGED